MIRWGILSTGTIAVKFANTLNQMKNEASLTAVASRSQEKAQEFAATYGIPKAFGSYEAMLCDPEVDAVYIATPNNLHYENIRDCILHHKHVLCEKPMTTDAKQAEDLFALAEKEGVFLMEGMWIAHLPLLKKLKELLHSGLIGEVKHLRADYGFVAKGARRTRKFESSLGGGALLDVGVYNLAFARMVLGDPTGFQSKVTFSEFGTDDFSTMLLEYPNGKTAAITTAIGIAMPTEGVIYGEKGKIYFPNYQQAQTLTVELYGETPYTIDMPFEFTGFEYQIREAARCIEAGLLISPFQTAEDTLAVLRTMDAIRESWGMKFTFEK